jgi:hypothetical protein
MVRKRHDFAVWEPTPSTSFTISLAAIQEVADWRANRRGPQTLTVIYPKIRIADELPIIDVCAEMDYYGVKNLYRKSNQYYVDHYLCLWEITWREIIGHWKWTDLAAIQKWYHEIILPDFRERTISPTLGEETLDLFATMNQLCYKFLSEMLYMHVE